MSDSHSPLMLQYLDLKASCGDAVLLMRVGDFYEMFNEDAEIGSRVLDITLTKKSVGKGQTVPLAGIPYHALHNYIFKLTRAGYRVAVCEQTEDPQKAKKLVNREIVRTVTPGTIIDSEVIDSSANNYLVAVTDGQFSGMGLAFADVSTGEFRYTVLTGSDAQTQLESELVKLAPSEVLLDENLPEESSIRGAVRLLTQAVITERPAECFATDELSDLDIAEPESSGDLAKHPELTALGLNAAGCVYGFIKETQKARAPHFLGLEPYSLSSYMLLEANTERNLELLGNIREGGKKGSLLSVLDKTVTAIGSRLLKRWIVRPLLSPKVIESRQEAVGALVRNHFLRDDLAQHLKQIPDIERLTGRVGFGNANARDLVALLRAAEELANLNRLIEPERELWPSTPSRWEVQNSDNPPQLELLDELPELVALLQPMLCDEPPVSVKDGGIFRDGFNKELDELREIRKGGKDWIARMRERERERTGITSLKISYNKVFGYYIEVTKANQHLVPDDYERKQTLVSSERYITQELKDYEAKVLGAQERICDLEFEMFTELVSEVRAFTERLLKVARSIAELDVFRSLADVAVRNNYARPVITTGSEILLEEARHPVLEQMSVVSRFVPNDCHLDDAARQLLLITGPNMAGKSTYIRQVALNVLLAQMGSFISANSATISIVDKLFTRVGASDNLAAGQSTFMVEMSETADILKKATPRSLIILDEIGRGTSTFDGVSLAWAIAEYIHNLRKKGVKTLFATHYHELADLPKKLPRAKNLRVLVAEKDGQVTFLYKIADGSTDHSYGIHVAELAGVPDPVIKRARKILRDLEGHATVLRDRAPETRGPVQLTLFSMTDDAISERLLEIQPEQMTPLEALQTLMELVRKVRG